MREIPSQPREALEVWFIPLASTCPVAWRCLMRHVSLHPSSFALPPGLRPRSNGHRRMPRQNRLRPSPHSLRKICRRAMGEAGGASFDHLVGAGEQRRGRDGQSERPGGLEVDHQLEFGWLLSIDKEGRFSESHTDFFDNPAWDGVRQRAQRKAIEMRSQGWSGAAMLPYSELEYGGFRDTVSALLKRFRLREERKLEAAE